MEVLQTLQGLIELYLTHHKKREDAALEAYRKAQSFEYLIERAIVGFKADGTRDPHKHRMQPEDMSGLKLYLLSKKTVLKNCRSFEEIMKVVYFAKSSGFVKRFGPLWVYDTALAIGAYYNHLPDDVFLHSGAKIGAERLLGVKIVREKALNFLGDNDYPVLGVNAFPKKVSVLAAHHIENFLCLYKDAFNESK